MAVAESFTLPDNPATGVLRITPLGGDGFTDPMFRYDLRNFQALGDASAGGISLSVVMDQRYCCMLSFCSMVYGGTGNDPMPVRYIWGGGIGGITPNQFRFVRADVVPATIGARVTDMWVPPAIMQPSDPLLTLRVETINEDTDVLQMFMSVFCYDINALQKVPMSQLVRSKGSSGNSATSA